jgi:hypothetical protein
MKVWTGTEKNDDKVIAFGNQTIYKGNSKMQDIESALFVLNAKHEPPKDLAGFPLSYIREINLTEGKDHIELLFGKDSSEELNIQDEQRRHEIFEYFKNNIPGSEYTLYKPGSVNAGKKPLIAFAVVAAIFSWTLYIALGIEAGNDYDVSGQHYNSIAGIVLAMASMGVKKVILIFGSLLAITLFTFIKKARNLPVIHKIILKH